MELDYVLRNLLKALILPPGGPLLLIILGLLLMGRMRRLATGMIVAAVVGLYLLSIPVTERWLQDVVEEHPSLLPEGIRQSGAQAIVILAGGRYRNVREYGGQDAVNLPTLARIRYGAWLHRRTGLPILVSGGTPRGQTVSEARLMDRSLREDFGLQARWLENKSDNTHENARFSAPILKRHGISNVILVTHASHMTRSLDAFEREGLSVIPGPIQTRSRGYDALDLYDVLPLPDALVASRSALHELLGRFWYRYNYDPE